MSEKVAILIVNGGEDPEQGKWLQLCLENVIRFTKYPNYHLYIWNNNVDDGWVDGYVRQFHNATLVQADPSEKLNHRHAVPLQRLYEISLKDNPSYIVTLDTDAFPICSEWLTGLIRPIKNGAVLSGVWRDELKNVIKPYVHPSCLCASTDFIKNNCLRFDDIPSTRNMRYDTLSVFTAKAKELGHDIYKLKRSNRNQLHSVISGIYGDTIYHHGAGSRKYVHFWNEKYNAKSDYKNIYIRDVKTEMLFNYYDDYIDWLRGAKLTNRFLFILGMHRSGTSCLAGCLERCGLYLGDVNRHSPYNVKGAHELNRVKRLNNEILSVNDGTWHEPPKEVSASEKQKKEISKFIKAMLIRSPSGLKDPRLLLVMEPWMEGVEFPSFVGTFRHPSAVVNSLKKRNQISEAASYKLWIHYNAKLVELHRKFHFPLIDFDLSNKEDYCYNVAAFAAELGLKPEINKIKEFVDTKIAHPKEKFQKYIPKECEDVYQYLMDNRYRPFFNENSFEYTLMKNMETLEYPLKLKIKERIEYTAYRFARYIPNALKKTIKPAIKITKSVFAKKVYQHK